MNRSSLKYLVLLALGIVVAMVFLFKTQPVKQVQSKEVLPVAVIVSQAKSQVLYPVERVTGRLQAAHKATLHFEVPGQLAERLVEPGEQVQAGQVLLKLAEGDYQDALAEARFALQQEQASVARDRQLLTLAERERALQAQAVARLESLGRDSLASRAQRDEAQTRLLQLQAEEARLRYSAETAAARVQQRETALSRAQRNLERTRLAAPFSGKVNAVYVQQGDYVMPTTPALDILDTAQLDLYVEVTGETAAALQLGQKVEVRIADTPRQGEIVALQTDPDPVTHTHPIRIRMVGQGGLPGELAEAELALTPLHHAITVPISAVLHEEGKAYVFRVENGVLQRTEVTLGTRVQDLQVIKAGLDAGAAIVARNVAALAHGQRVRTQ